MFVDSEDCSRTLDGRVEQLLLSSMEYDIE